MLGLAASLSLLLALTHLPVQSPIHRVGWSTQSPADRIALSEIDSEHSSDESTSRTTDEAPPATALQRPQSEQTAQPTPSENPGDGSSPGDTSRVSDLDKVRSVTTLGTAAQKPKIIGGKGRLYLNINYPAKAREQGIEGRMSLRFTVRADGSVTNIDIAESLHPLCDSAAVEGLRSVQFIPAKHEGTPVPIRMKLPIRFQLTAMSSTLEPSGSGP